MKKINALQTTTIQQ